VPANFSVSSNSEKWSRVSATCKPHPRVSLSLQVVWSERSGLLAHWLRLVRSNRPCQQMQAGLESLPVAWALNMRRVHAFCNSMILNHEWKDYFHVCGTLADASPYQCLCNTGRRLAISVFVQRWQTPRQENADNAVEKVRG
jgi:hypothetical protein